MSTEQEDGHEDYGGAWYGDNMQAFLRLLLIMVEEAETVTLPNTQSDRKAES